jgi:hypothetical protein
LLTEGFSDADLRRFCFDEPDFRPVYNELAGATGKAAIVDALLAYTTQQELIDKLLDWAKAENPAKYNKLKPYVSAGTLSDTDRPPANVVDQPAVDKEIFISYAWGGESEQIVNQIDQAFQNKEITLVRDKRNLRYKGRIQEFMEWLGRGKAVIVVISEKYLKSPNCMFELVQIAKNGQFHDRIFPIVLADAQIYRPVQRIQYVQHWEQEIKQLDEAMKTVSAANLQGFRDEIDQYTEIRNTIAELTHVIKDMNTLTPEMHSKSGFTELFKAIENKLAE